MIRNSPGASTSFSMSAKERPRQVCAERRSKNGKQRSKRRRVTGHWAQYHPGGRQPKGTSLVRRIAAGRSIMIERQETVECGLVLLVRDKTPSRSVRLCARHGPEHGVQVVLDNGPPPLHPPMPPTRLLECRATTTRLSGPSPTRPDPARAAAPPDSGGGVVCARTWEALRAHLQIGLLSGSNGACRSALGVPRNVAVLWLRAASDGWVDL